MSPHSASLFKYYEGLNSPRLSYRKLTYQDIDSWAAFYQDNPNLKYIGIDLNRTPREMATSWIATQLQRYESNNFGQLGIVIKDTEELVGTVGFINHKYSEEGLLVEKGTAIKPVYWRKGFGTEASITLINYIFENNLAQKIIGHRHIDNIESQKMSQKLGYKETEIIQQAHRIAVKYELTKDDWLEKKDFFYVEF
jgi:[ribosomal protein S5]-alanine N-acetyltransferase